MKIKIVDHLDTVVVETSYQAPDQDAETARDSAHRTVVKVSKPELTPPRMTTLEKKDGLFSDQTLPQRHLKRTHDDARLETSQESAKRKKDEEFAASLHGAEHETQSANHSQSIVESRAQGDTTQSKHLLRRLGATGVKQISRLSPSLGALFNSGLIVMEALRNRRVFPTIADMSHHIENFGPFTSKLGQLFATDERVSPSIRQHLMHLCDKNQPEPFEFIKQQIESAAKQLGFEVLEIIETPLGVGTIAQVHRATIKKDGQVRECAIKVVKQDIRSKLENDFESLSFLLSTFYPWYKDSIDEAVKSVIGFHDKGSQFRQGFTYVVMEDLLENIKRETSMTSELIKMKRYGKSLSDINPEHFKVPEGLFASEDVLVMEYIHGDTLSHLTASGHKSKAAYLYSQSCQVWQDVLKNKGDLHGDIHPGNLMLDRSDKIVFIDCGSVLPNSKNIKRLVEYMELMREWLEEEKAKGFPEGESFTERKDYLQSQLMERQAINRDIARRYDNKNDVEVTINYLDDLYDKRKKELGLSHSGSKLARLVQLHMECFTKNDDSVKRKSIEEKVLRFLASSTCHYNLGSDLPDNRVISADDASERLQQACSHPDTAEMLFNKIMTYDHILPVEYCYYLQCDARIKQFEKECFAGSGDTQPASPVKARQQDKPFRVYSAKDIREFREKHRISSLFSDKFVNLLINEQKNYKPPLPYLRSKYPPGFYAVPKPLTGFVENEAEKLQGESAQPYKRLDLEKLDDRQTDHLIKKIEQESQNKQYSADVLLSAMEWWILDVGQPGFKREYSEREICMKFLDRLRFHRYQLQKKR